MKVKLKICTQCNLEKVIWKSIGKRDKYCKECWFKQEPPKKAAPISKKKKIEMDTYSKLREAFLVVKPHCEAKLQGCTGHSSDVHHKMGRIGENYLKISTWLSTCRSCHSWIELNSEAAKELGFSQSRLNIENDDTTRKS